MLTITFKVAAKTDMGLVRTNNEDNLCAISNLDVEGSTWVNNDICQLGRKGALLVVADGMGGMNAGEVASEIAVSVVKERFTNEVSDEVLKSDESMVKFMNESIVQADNTIKKEGKHRPEAVMRHQAALPVVPQQGGALLLPAGIGSRFGSQHTALGRRIPQRQPLQVVQQPIHQSTGHIVDSSMGQRKVVLGVE